MSAASGFVKHARIGSGYCTAGRAHDQFQCIHPIVFETYEVQFTGNGNALLVQAHENVAAAADEIELRIDPPLLDQCNLRKMREQAGNVLPHQLAQPVTEQALRRLAAILDQAALVQQQRRRLIPVG